MTILEEIREPGGPALWHIEFENTHSSGGTIASGYALTDHAAILPNVEALFRAAVGPRYDGEVYTVTLI